MDGLLSPEADSLRVLSIWRQYLGANYSEGAVDDYFGHVFRFLKSCPKPLVEVSEQDVDAWLSRYPFRSASRRGGYQALKVLFDWMENHRLLVVNPMRLIRVPPVVERQARALTESELEAVFRAAGERAPYRADALRLLYHTGGRLKEILNLRWTDVSESFILLRVTKNGKERRVPITAPLHTALVGLADRFGTKGKVVPRSGETIWKWCAEAGKDVGIERVHPHLFRSTAVTHMLNQGAPVQAVKELVGHANIKTTNRYAAATYDDVVAAAALLHGARAHQPVADVQHATGGSAPWGPDEDRGLPAPGVGAAS